MTTLSDLGAALANLFRPKPSVSTQTGLSSNWGRIVIALMKALDDAKANAPRPPATPVTGKALSSAIDKVIALAPVLKAYADAHPGELTAADDICDALIAAGFTWAVSLKSGVDAVPWMLAEASDYLPALKFLLGEFAPAPIGIPGGWSGARGHV